MTEDGWPIMNCGPCCDWFKDHPQEKAVPLGTPAGTKVRDRDILTDHEKSGVHATAMRKKEGRIQKGIKAASAVARSQLQGYAPLLLMAALHIIQHHQPASSFPGTLLLINTVATALRATSPVNFRYNASR
jgi:hypothetical protein